jgi:hypothetical protein
VCIVVLLAGCGGSSSSSSKTVSTAAFKPSFQPIIDQFKGISHSIGTELQQASGETNAQLATAFHQLANQWQSRLSQLETLTPPANLATTFNTLTGAATRAEADLNSIASAAQTGSKSRATQAVTNLLTDVTAAKAASTTLTQKLGIQ